jgi:hypothetical protein
MYAYIACAGHTFQKKVKFLSEEIEESLLREGGVKPPLSDKIRDRPLRIYKDRGRPKLPRSDYERRHALEAAADAILEQDEPSPKKLNRQYREQRLAGKTKLSYSAWMAEQAAAD